MIQRVFPVDNRQAGRIMLGHGGPERAVDDPIESLRHRVRHNVTQVMADAGGAFAISRGGR